MLSSPLTGMARGTDAWRQTWAERVQEGPHFPVETLEQIRIPAADNGCKTHNPSGRFG